MPDVLHSMAELETCRHARSYGMVLRGPPSCQAHDSLSGCLPIYGAMQQVHMNDMKLQKRQAAQAGHGLSYERISPYTLTPVSALTALTHPEQHNQAASALGMTSDLLTSLGQSILGMRKAIWTKQGQQNYLAAWRGTPEDWSLLQRRRTPAQRQLLGVTSDILQHTISRLFSGACNRAGKERSTDHVSNLAPSDIDQLQQGVGLGRLPLDLQRHHCKAAALCQPHAATARTSVVAHETSAKKTCNGALVLTSKEDNDGCIIHRIPAQERVHCQWILLVHIKDVRGVILC